MFLGTVKAHAERVVLYSLIGITFLLSAQALRSRPVFELYVTEAALPKSLARLPGEKGIVQTQNAPAVSAGSSASSLSPARQPQSISSSLQVSKSPLQTDVDAAPVAVAQASTTEDDESVAEAQVATGRLPDPAVRAQELSSSLSNSVGVEPVQSQTIENLRSTDGTPPPNGATRSPAGEAGASLSRDSIQEAAVVLTPAGSRDGTGALLGLLNEGDASDLSRLKGIGQVLAERIVSYREANGLFYSPYELINVPGIGEKKLQAILDGLSDMPFQ